MDAVEALAAKYAADWPAWGRRKIAAMMRADGHDHPPRPQWTELAELTIGYGENGVSVYRNPELTVRVFDSDGKQLDIGGF